MRLRSVFVGDLGKTDSCNLWTGSSGDGEYDEGFSSTLPKSSLD